MLTFYESTPGKKTVVAVTGIILFGFIIGHMTGNLKTFAGVADDGIHKLDWYAHFLRTIGAEMLGYGGFLWAFRAVLLGALILHVLTVFQLQAKNRTARPVEYAAYSYKSSTIAARSMLLGGIVILGFIFFHIAHLTLGWIDPSLFTHGHVYENVFNAFKQPLYVGLYSVALIFLGLHLYHGLWSLTQTLGIDRPDRNHSLRMLARTIALLIALGFIAVPIGISAGLTIDPPANYLEL